MKSLSVIIGALLFAFAAWAALPQPDLIAQIHFAGAAKISADPHSHAFTNEFTSAEALALRAQTADKLSVWLGIWLQTNLNVTVAGGAAKLRPLLDDLQSAEWFLEARSTAGKPEAAIAIKLEAARAALWQASLKPFFAAASFKSAGGWLIFDSDPGQLKLGDRLAQKIAAPGAEWLEADINWPRLAQWNPELKALSLPETHFTVTAPDDNFRISGKCFFPENLALNLEPWRVPTNTIHPPFDSFTAARGFAPWLQQQTWAQPYLIAPVPNQLFAWSLQAQPFQSFAAMPVPSASGAFSQLYPKLVSAFAAADARHDFITSIKPLMTNNEVLFTGMPFMMPGVLPVNDPAGQYLMFEGFPNSPSRKPLPPELLQRLAMKDLVYYHWEITAQRIPQILNMSQLGLMMTSRKQLLADNNALKWLQRIGSQLANTDTEITQSGPAEFTFNRKGQGLFTAAEFFVLANWLEAPNFPGYDLKQSQRLLRTRRVPPQTMPTPTPGH